MSRTTAFNSELWRAERRRWGIPAALLGLGLLLFLLFQFRYAGRVDGLDGEFGRESARLDELLENRTKAEGLLGEAAASRDGIVHLYDDVFKTEATRLTKAIAEVKNLARRAGLEPPGISYPEEVFEDHELLRMSFVFAVRGDYDELRRFINFLELSDQFLILEEIRVSDTDEGSLAVSLQISTLFERSQYRQGLEASGGAR